MSFLEEENVKQSSFWDWVVGIGLLILIGGFTLFYQFQKGSSNERFAEADSLFQAGSFVEAESHYEELKSAQYLTPSHDSVLYARLDSIEAMRDLERDALERVKTQLESGDTSAVRKEMEAFSFKNLLPKEDQYFLQTLGVAARDTQISGIRP